MKYSQLIGVFLVAGLIGICYIPWVHLPGLPKDVSGADTTGTNWGRPLTFFLIFGGLMLLMFLLPTVWAKRTNFFAGALMVSYAVRTFIVFSLCDMGYCPERKAGIYLMLIFSLLAFAMTLMPKLIIKKRANG